MPESGARSVNSEFSDLAGRRLHGNHPVRLVSGPATLSLSNEINRLHLSSFLRKTAAFPFRANQRHKLFVHLYVCVFFSCMSSLPITSKSLLMSTQ